MFFDKLRNMVIDSIHDQSHITANKPASENECKMSEH